VTSTRGERGAAAVEFALVVPLLLLLVLGIAEFGRAYNIESVLAGAAREGARSMALQNNATAARSAVQLAAPSLGLTTGQISISPSSCPTSTGSTTTQLVTVTVTYQMTFVTKLFGTSKTLQAKGAMRCNG
jgi:Flp pilus assembly protein TadG